VNANSTGDALGNAKTTVVLKVEQNMEMKGATLLYTLAGLMITFAGFSSLLLTVRPAAGA
jgi:hypothetical protein